MKKTLFLLLVVTITCCSISCKKECVCWGFIDTAFDDANGAIATADFEESVGKLSNKDCKNWENHTTITRDDEREATITTTYVKCQLQ